MNARDQLLGVLVKLHGWHPNEANILIDDFAHALADQQRAALDDLFDRYDRTFHEDAFTDLIAVIDPKTQTATSKETSA